MRGIKKLTQLLLFCIVSVLMGCWGWGGKPPEPIRYKKVWGYKPVFTADTTFYRVQAEPPRPMKNPGKIYVRDRLIFQNDIGYGIHVIDNADPAQARAIGFIKVSGSSEMSIKGDHMYVNSFSTLVVLDVSDWQQVSVVRRIPNAFQHGLTVNGQHYFIPPPEHGVFYDCSLFNYDPGKLQTGWVRDSVFDMCYYK
jgi:hypothetical protein